MILQMYFFSKGIHRKFLLPITYTNMKQENISTILTSSWETLKKAEMRPGGPKESAYAGCSAESQKKTKLFPS